MALPLSRNKTYGASTPVRSTDINEIQDQIIGGKHGAVKLWLPHENSWVATSGNDPTFNFWDSASVASNTVSSSMSLVQSPPLLIGTVITQIDCIYVDNDATENFTFTIEPFLDTGETSKSSSGQSTSPQVISFTAADDPDAFPYTVDPLNMDTGGDPNQLGILRLRVAWQANLSADYFGSVWHIYLP